MTKLKLTLMIAAVAALAACAQQEEPEPMMEPMEVPAEPEMSKM